MLKRLLNRVRFRRGDPNGKPKRIQRSRKKGWRMPPNTVYVGRPTKWGNPFTVNKYGREAALERFHLHLCNPNSALGFDLGEIKELRGKNLACWCPLDAPCHADVLLELANRTR
ncbi:MAG TPA: DUF4326 domain-containing protein [Gammaproteobacteria bacterium]|nr:DUF4326 domain-containing protein [Gammaproteobacteria bacterium]